MLIRGDSKLLFQAFSNLISNAIKYSKDCIRITVGAEQSDGRTTVIVADHGIGIPPRDLEYLFTRYFRGSNAHGIMGTGVGLYLVATVAHTHGGSITVESLEGEGSRFIMALPNG
jgi:two-component system OmpR family sensor kinase